MTESPIILENLSVKEVKELLETRIKYLSIANLISQKPYEDEVISKLYTLYDGNLRYILNSLSTLFNELIRDIPIKVSIKELIKVLPETAKKRWLNKLTLTEQEILFYILKEGEANNKKIAVNLGKKPQNISTIIKHLLDLSAIRISRIEGKEKYFVIEHSIKWFLLEKEDKKPIKTHPLNIHKEIQEVLKI